MSVDTGAREPQEVLRDYILSVPLAATDDDGSKKAAAMEALAALAAGVGVPPDETQNSVSAPAKERQDARAEADSPELRRVGALRSFAKEMRDLAQMKTPDEWALQHWNRSVRKKLIGFVADVEAVALDAERLYKQTVTKSADSPITEERPRDVGAPGAVT